MKKSERCEIIATIFVVGGFCAIQTIFAPILFGIGVLTALGSLYYAKKEGEE